MSFVGALQERDFASWQGSPRVCAEAYGEYAAQAKRAGNAARAEKRLMKSPGNETIAAAATAAGGGIGIVRISGPDALTLAGKIFHSKGARPLASCAAFSLVLGTVCDPVSGAPIDEALAVHMPAGHSYTGDQTVEIQAHGGRVVLGSIVQATLRAGARLAEPGEFTKRAFLSGRLDLTQAEAIAALIAAEDEAEHFSAVQHLRGALASKVRGLRERLLDISVRLEAILDFEEHEVPEDLPAEEEVESLAVDMRNLANQAGTTSGGRSVARIVLAGRPNSGKSSIFNYLLEFDRSIVSSRPGTTTDYLEQRSILGGNSVTLVDTAGFCETNDDVEAEGVRRSIRQIREADIVILILDGSEPNHPDASRLFELASGRSPIVLISKSDLPLQVDVGDIGHPITELPVFRVSTHTGEGFTGFTKALASRCSTVTSAAAHPEAAPNFRHRDALERAAGFLDSAADCCRVCHGRFDQAAAEIIAALNALGEITGETASDEILDRIFSRFCVGK